MTVGTRRIVGKIQPRQIVAERLARPCLGLLGQVADEAGRDDLSLVRLVEAGEDPEQRGLADPVRPDQRDPRARRHDEVDVVQDAAGTVGLGDATNGEQ